MTGTRRTSDGQRHYRKVPTAELVDALAAHHGLIGPAAESLGGAPLTIRRRAAASPAIAAALAEARERTIDLAEQRLYDAIDRGELQAVMFVLKTLGKGRGYSEKLELVTDARQHAERIAAAEGLDANELIREAERIANGQR